ncbi:YidC/Oxa1 family membrane protein insertase [Dyella psychrodurans]|uniref:Membrane protein insertase YidC n=1 Tax=Dyella psychrodurans TaxID=1927960 RepID=A0A370XDE8_9GAMM|nr:membrane protein insertase YidC [Dyella psychrodurans]RDS86463.1 membrane protein insertase YidC [Dyella psychrodurans]
MWSTFVGGLIALLAQLAHWLDGSYGAAVVVMAIVVRLILLPMTLHTAEQAWHRQHKLARLKPELERLRERHTKDPTAYATALQALYRKHEVTGGLGSGMLTAIVQAPLGAGIYAAIRQSVVGAGSFLWIGRLARPDIWLAFIVALLSWAAIMLNPSMSEQARTLLHWLPVIVTFLVTWHLSAGLCLYWAGAGSVGVLQAALLRHRVTRSSHRAQPPRR